MTFAHGETVTRQRATATTDPYSGEDTDLSWADPDETDIENVAVEPVSAFEAAEVGRERVDIDLRLYLPYGADVMPLDRVLVRGGTFEVQGARADWRNPYTGSEPGSVVECRQVVG
jgi:head-tail adaptor